MFLFWGWVNRKPYLTLSPREGIFFWVGGRKFWLLFWRTA